MKKILLTAFLPFGEHQTNASESVVNAYCKDICGVEIIKVYLDVVYDYTYFALLIKKYQPDIILLCGQAEMRDKVTIEQVAINFLYATIPDNRGQLKLGEMIDEAGDRAYFTSIPAVAIVSKLSKIQMPVALSLNAGGYVCNFSFYTLLQQTENSNVQVGFIHFPLIKSENTKSSNKGLTLSTMVEILDSIILELVTSE